jgi:hypothetical protein
MEDFATPAPAVAAPANLSGRSRAASWRSSPRPRRCSSTSGSRSWFVPLLVTLALVVVFIVVLWNPVMLPNMLARFEEKDTPQNVVDMMTKTA